VVPRILIPPSARRSPSSRTEFQAQTTTPKGSPKGWPTLILVTPRTVVNWHRAGFRLYWTWVSRISQVGGRKRVSKEVRALIFRMVSENPTWGAPRIHGELLKLGFELSERSVSRWIRRAPRDPDSVKRWLTFLRNHREAIAAMDFFTV